MTIKQAVGGTFDNYNTANIVTSIAVLQKFHENFFLRTKELTEKNEEAKMG